MCLGSGALGSMLADHDDVDKVAFTGSTPIGRVLRRRIAGSGSFSLCFFYSFKLFFKNFFFHFLYILSCRQENLT